jgi:hypothetical protein
MFFDLCTKLLLKSGAIALGLFAISPNYLQAEVIISGNAILTIDQSAFASQSSITTLAAWFDNSETRTQLLGNPAPGDGFTLPNINHSINVGIIPDPDGPGGRTIQTSNLDIDPNNILGTWTASSDIGAFVGSGTSEQIALEGMQRWLGNYTGQLLFGDFAIRYSPSRVGVVREGNTLSGLVLTSNIDFANAAFLDIADATITSNGASLSISGDLVISDGYKVLDAGALLGADVGDISLTAAIPEPSTVVTSCLLVTGMLCAMLRRKQRNQINYAQQV